MENPMKKDVAGVKIRLRYLRKIKYHNTGDKGTIKAYCDADYVGDTKTRKSTTRYIIFYCVGPISWCSRRQLVVTLSSTQAEYIAATECCKEVLFPKNLIEEITVKPIKANMYIDNQSAITLIKNGVLNKRIKHT